MTDKELLELAAKAAGKTISRWIGSVPILDDGKMFVPLEDRGDALLLAVELGLSLDCYIARACKGGEVDVCEDKFKDSAAVCRAIVRAAAEIGASC